MALIKPRFSLSLLIVSVTGLLLGSAGLAFAFLSRPVAAYVPFEFKTMSGLDKSDFKTAMEEGVRSDHISAYYQNPDTKALTRAFFESLTGDIQIAEAILEQSIKRDVSPALAFALAYEESGFNPRAFNRNEKSVDRGIFQLNSLSFPTLGVEEFYDIETNVRLGLAHLEFCLDSGGNDVAALAVYNAGLGRVSKGGTPKRTLDYIYKITGSRDRLEALFEAQVVAKHSESSTLAVLNPASSSRD